MCHLKRKKKIKGLACSRFPTLPLAPRPWPWLGLEFAWLSAPGAQPSPRVVGRLLAAGSQSLWETERAASSPGEARSPSCSPGGAQRRIRVARGRAGGIGPSVGRSELAEEQVDSRVPPPPGYSSPHRPSPRTRVAECTPPVCSAGLSLPAISRPHRKPGQGRGFSQRGKKSPSSREGPKFPVPGAE